MFILWFIIGRKFSYKAENCPFCRHWLVLLAKVGHNNEEFW